MNSIISRSSSSKASLVDDNGSMSSVNSSPRLKDIDFTDLLLSVNGACIMRGASGPGPLQAISEDHIEDIHELRLAAMNKGQNESEFYVDHDEIRYRVSVINDLDGIWYAIRKSKSVIPNINSLGFARPVINYLGKLGRRSGLIILAGATGHGKTTTAYSLMNAYLNAFGNIAVTIEDPPEMVLNGPRGKFGHCFQLKLGPDETFGDALHRSMRYTPQYILMGEIRSAHDASQALRASISGHLVVTTIHAGNVIEAINSMLTLTAHGDDSVDFAREQLSSGLAGVIHQRLMNTPGQNGKSKKVLKTQMLFTGDDMGIRSKIADGKTAQLSSDIALQANRIKSDEEPVKLPSLTGG